MGFVEKLVSDRRDNICLICGKDASGLPAYYFVLIHANKHFDIQSEFDRGNYDVESYGKILLSGYGDRPPLRAWEEMEIKYGCTKK